MNVNVHNTISMVSSMVGVPHSSGGAKQIAKDQAQSEKSSLDRDASVDGEGEEGVSEGEESSYHKPKAQAGQANSAQSKQQAAAASRRRISEETLVKNESEDSKTEETGKTAQAGQAGKSSSTAAQKGTGFLDTSRLIQQKFTETKEAQQDSAKQRPDVQRKQFAENLKKWVQLEYNQYSKGTDPLYTRRNLREILNALGDQNTKTQKTSSKEDSTGKSQVGFSKFNKYNITQASNALRIFEEIPSPEDNLSYDLVA